MKDVKVEDIAQDVSKINDEQLKKLQEFVSKINSAQLTIGQLETQKATMLSQLFLVQEELGKFQKELEEEYGKVNVSIQDGTIKAIEDESVDQKN